MRLIDADALVSALRQYQYPYGVEFLVSTQPTIEAEPVKHGKWLGLHDGWYYSYSCSECGSEALTKEETMHDQVCSPYCPNCGAKMDLEG